jgi:phenylpropionate dioxygenase-like ring-hydroxylating dioxygenase large terminal subunit
MLTSTGPRHYSGFVDMKRGLVNRRIFADREIYDAELERIFARCWLYLAHESQVSRAGDFVTVLMGEQPVIVCRTAEDKIAAFINSCRHRGNAVCRVDAGNTKAFVCPYHGWTYDTRGDLTGVPGHRDLYHGELDQKAFGLPKVAQVDTYRGMIFGTFDPEAPPLEEFLGDVRFGLDLLFDQGEMVALPSITRWTMDVNWKFASDNAIGDMYHATVTHRSAMLAGYALSNGGVSSGGIPPPRLDGGFTLISAYGHGLNANYIGDWQVNMDSPLTAWRRDAAVLARLGPMRSRVNRANMLVFPNLFVNSGSRELSLRNPMGPGRMEIWKTVLVDKNASPETQRSQVRASNRHFGPAGMFEQDDGENWDQSTAAASSPIARRYELNYSMGVGHGAVVSDKTSPPRIDTLTNEHAQLWMYGCWAEFMDAEDWPALRSNHSEPSGMQL